MCFKIRAPGDAHQRAGGYQIPHLQARIGKRQTRRTDHRCELVATCEPAFGKSVAVNAADRLSWIISSVLAIWFPNIPRQIRAYRRRMRPHLPQARRRTRPRWLSGSFPARPPSQGPHTPALRTRAPGVSASARTQAHHNVVMHALRLRRGHGKQQYPRSMLMAFEVSILWCRPHPRIMPCRSPIGPGCGSFI